jgi:hypothetical protein
VLFKNAGLQAMTLGSKTIRLIALSVALLATLLFAVRYGSQFALYLRIRSAMPATDSTGHLSATPRVLLKLDKDYAKGTSLSYFGCRFEVPWQDVELERNEGRWAEVQFKTGQTIRVLNSNQFYVDGFIDAQFVDPNVWKMALIEGFPKSRYAQLTALLSATPTQLSPFQSRPKFARTLVLLKQKGIYFEHDPFKPEIFSFESPSLRGFEIIGISPGNNPTNIEEATLSFFNSQDKLFVLRIRGSRSKTLTQSEINRVIDTFVFLDSPTPG